MTGEVETEGGASFLHCSVNGVKSRPKLVILDDTVHLFSKVGFLCLSQDGREFFGSAPPDWLPAGSPHPLLRSLCRRAARRCLFQCPSTWPASAAPGPKEEPWLR